MRTTLALLCLVACGSPLYVERPCPPPEQPAEPVVPEAPDHLVEVRVGDIGYCTRSQQGAVRCHATSVDFTVVERGAIAMGVVDTFVYQDELLACALLDQGRIACANTSSRYELQIDGAIELTVGGGGVCGRTQAGEVWCAGDEGAAATRVDGLAPAVAIAATPSALCTLDAAGAVRCSGDADTNAVPQGLVAVSISGGYNHFCAVRPDGWVQCWGSGTPKPPFERVSGVVCGIGSTCWLDASEHAVCWFGADSLAPGLPALKQVDIGGYGICGLDLQGGVVCEALGWP